MGFFCMMKHRIVGLSRFCWLVFFFSTATAADSLTPWSEAEVAWNAVDLWKDYDARREPLWCHFLSTVR